ncbi:hypothetical protein EDD11_005197 [Mortierella claussenii]|nr:hypothetical protein EDD11_005197 [Mortierella claussenii]
MRLLHSASSPSPFCTHGLAPCATVTPVIVNAHATLEIQSAKQLRHLSIPQISRQSYSTEQHAQHQRQDNAQSQDFCSQESVDCTVDPSKPFSDGLMYDDRDALRRSRQHVNASTHHGPAIQGHSVRPRASSIHYEQLTVSAPGSIELQLGNHYLTPPSGRFTSYGAVGLNVQRQSQQQISFSQRQQCQKYGFQIPVILNAQPPISQPTSNPYQYQEGYSNFSETGRRGSLNSRTGVCRENDNDLFGAQGTPQAQGQHLLYPHFQQRRSSYHHIFHTSNTASGYQTQQPGYVMGTEKLYHGTNNQTVETTSMLSFSALPNLPPATPPAHPRAKAIQWAVVRVTNIPWDVSLQDMLLFFSGLPFPPEHLLSQNVHILIDRSTGKTINTAFVELALTPHQAGLAVQYKNMKQLKGRVVTVVLSSQDELMNNMFPKWEGEFLEGEPITPGERADSGIAVEKDVAGASERLSTNDFLSATSIAITAMVSTPPFVTREEISMLLMICRNYKLHFSRKCAERPFENIISILAKYPWHWPHRVPPLHRDHIFELLKLSIESLKSHLSKEYNTIHPTLLLRMVRSAILTPAFTERQKAMVLHTAGCSCPEDIVGWMTQPMPQETGIGSGAVVENRYEKHNAEPLVKIESTLQTMEAMDGSATELKGCGQGSLNSNAKHQVAALGISDTTGDATELDNISSTVSTSPDAISAVWKNRSASLSVNALVTSEVTFLPNSGQNSSLMPSSVTWSGIADQSALKSTVGSATLIESGASRTSSPTQSSTNTPSTSAFAVAIVQVGHGVVNMRSTSSGEHASNSDSTHDSFIRRDSVPVSNSTSVWKSTLSYSFSSEILSSDDSSRVSTPTNSSPLSMSPSISSAEADALTGSHSCGTGKFKLECDHGQRDFSTLDPS